MYLAFAVVLLALATLSVQAGLRAAAGPDQDSVRGFCLVGALGCVVAVIGVLVAALFWDGRVADAIGIVSLFALVAYYLAALVISGRPPRSRPGKPAEDPAAAADTP